MGKKKRRIKSTTKITQPTIADFLRSHPTQAYSIKQIAAALQIRDSSGRNQLIKKLGVLSEQRIIAEVSIGTYKWAQQKNYLQGQIQITAKGKAYVKIDGWEEEVVIDKRRTNRALNKDIVSRLFVEVEANEGYSLVVDLPAETLTTPSNELIPFEVDAYKKQCLLNGLDEIGVTLQEADTIREFESRWRQRAPWYFSNVRPGDS